ncbi:MAG: dihydropteroate synthase [Deltaproteobacteria bacterium]|jgi:dihydropteroate synthase|nr:dihydropteroate synthase [Deltaproteobacteria bacterium]
MFPDRHKRRRLKGPKPPAPAFDPESPLSWTHPDGRRFTLDFSRPVVMGVLNVTPDSFSDGGKWLEPEAAVARAKAMADEGAHIIDIGAETTRPGSAPTPEDEEWRRLLPVLEALRELPGCPPVSVDTYRFSTAARCVMAGASMLNDIYAGRKEKRIFRVASDAAIPIVLMHMQGEPRTMQQEPHYADVVSEVREFLWERAKDAERNGVPKDRIILDPGLGFGKTADHNLMLLRNLPEAFPPGYRTMMALSRKAFLGKILDGAPPEGRDLATAVASSISFLKGAKVVRVHNVKAASEALKVAEAVMRGALTP